MTGKLVVDALSDRGVLAGWTPSSSRRRAAAPPRAAGRCAARSSAPETSTGPSACYRTSVPAMEEHVALARYTTIGTGGPARFFARPESLDELSRAPSVGGRERRARRDDRPRLEPPRRTTTVSTRSCSSSPASSRRCSVDGRALVAGGGASNAVALHRARAAGLGGFEFAAAIPGTAGGGVRMNAGAYGRDWREVMVEAVVVDAGRCTHADRRRARPFIPAFRPRARAGRRARFGSSSSRAPRTR